MSKPVTTTRRAALNRARVAACEARGDDTAIGTFQYDGRWLTMLVRMRKGLNDVRYLSDEEANSYDPGAHRAYDALVRRAMTALIDDILAGRITLNF